MSDYKRLVTVLKFANLSENLSPEVGIGVAAVASYLTTSTDLFTVWTWNVIPSYMRPYIPS